MKKSIILCLIFLFCIVGFMNSASAYLLECDFDKDGDVDSDDLAVFAANYGSISTFTNSFGMTFEFIPKGTFMMGSPDGSGGINGSVAESGRQSDETLHEVTLTQDFYMQTTELTQAQWEAVMGAGTNPSSFASCGVNCPVEMVSWFDVVIYCNRLSIIEGLTPYYYVDAAFTTVFDGTPPVTSGTVYWDQSANGYRLPTEAQWEYAARAGSTTAFANGPITSLYCGLDPNLGAMGWYCYNNTPSGTKPVAQKDANAWGLYDMHGNVFEWCQDFEGDYPTNSVIDPVGPASGVDRMARGGYWYDYARECRSARRNSSPNPGLSVNILGFRLALLPSQ